VKRKRNGKLVDIWSLTHILWGLVFAYYFPPFLAFLLLAAWEPFENLVLSPFLWRYFNVNFGHESLQNALSDIFFDGIGILLGLLIFKIF
jgi:multisubunit Na+/H+ antiporter MnhB subunit